jgi:hypothetical protein
VATSPDPDTEAREPPRFLRRWTVNGALLLAVAALAAFYLYHRGQPRTDAGPPLTSIAPAQVARVQIERPGQPPIVLEKTTSDWRLTGPFAARANRFAVDAVLRVAHAPRALSLEAGDLRQYGLVTPQALLRLDGTVIEFGALHPFQHQVYVRHQGTVSLISATALSAVVRAPGHFVDGRLLEPGAHLLALRLPGFHLALEDGRWQRRPSDTALTSDQLSDFVARWTHAQALSVAPAGKRPTLATIQLTRARPGSSPEILALDVLAYKPTFVLRRRDEKLEYHFPEEIGKQLLETGGN